MWTFRPHQAREVLESMSELVERLKNLMDIDDDVESTCSDDEVTTEAEEIAKIQLASQESPRMSYFFYHKGLQTSRFGVWGPGKFPTGLSNLFPGLIEAPRAKILT